MAQLSTEQSAYIKNQQQYLADAKVGQFAKFLDKNPTYVTYYVINQARSTTDAGTGAIYEEIGPQASVRFNKVLELPIFNLPELKPDVIQDEGGYDTEMDITDIAFIPNTVRPKPGDYMRIDIPGVVPLLFRCNTYRHNTIKSNDYYMGDFDLVDIDQKYIKMIEDQVVEVYNCHFENIGTNQKVMISQTDEAKIDDCHDLVDTLIDFYNDAFYNADMDAFILYDASSVLGSGSGGNGSPAAMGTQWYCDNYLTRFINESEIFRNDASDHTVILPYLEILPLNFNTLYGRTVWNAVLKRNKDYIHQYMYAWNRLIQKRVSPLMMATIPTLHPTLEMFDHYVKPSDPVPDNLKSLIWQPGTPCGWNGSDPLLRTYFSYDLLQSLYKGASQNLNSIELMIFQYITGGINSVTYTKKELLDFAFKQDIFTYMHMPIVIYILKQHLASLNSADS